MRAAPVAQSLGSMALLIGILIAYREPKLLVDNDGAHASQDRGVLGSSHIRNQLQPGTNNHDLFGHFHSCVLDYHSILGQVLW